MTYYKHGHSTGRQGKRTPTYLSWASMKQRCTDPSHSSWSHYGGRGIRFCERWLEFDRFLEDMGERPRGHSLHRLDNDKDYSPDNCKWATYREQSAKGLGVVMVVLNGETMNAQEAARRVGMNGSTLRNRLRRGMSIEQAVLAKKVSRF